LRNVGLQPEGDSEARMPHVYQIMY